MPPEANSKEVQPLLIAVAPNGARKQKSDHPALPITPLELAETAVKCCDAGAAMMHLHVRDAQNAHSLEPSIYRKAVREIKAAVGDRMLIQVTSEAAGVYQAPQQMEAMLALAPGCISAGLREFIPDETAIDSGGAFFTRLHAMGTLVQYILYSPDDIAWFQQLCQQGVIPGQSHLVLLVLGRYGAQTYGTGLLPQYLEVLYPATPWMVCAFGTEEPKVMQQAAALGGHCRVGFENNLWLPDGTLAEDNAALVRLVADMARQQGRPLADRALAVQLYGT